MPEENKKLEIVKKKGMSLGILVVIGFILIIIGIIISLCLTISVLSEPLLHAENATNLGIVSIVFLLVFPSFFNVFAVPLIFIGFVLFLLNFFIQIKKIKIKIIFGLAIVFLIWSFFFFYVPSVIKGGDFKVIAGLTKDELFCKIIPASYTNEKGECYNELKIQRKY